MQKKWMLKQTSVDVDALAQDANIHPVLAHVLAVRGYRKAEEIKLFMNSDYTKLADIFLFKDMEKAISITTSAIQEHKKITIFGDYDVDGISSTVILYRTLQYLNANVSFFIPKRADGYGLNPQVVREIKKNDTDLIIACDNGIAAFNEVSLAKELGMDIIILDHHEIPVEIYENGETKQVVPTADAIVDPKQSNCNYPYKHFCAAGICYRFAQGLVLSNDADWSIPNDELTIFAMLGTVCDLVALNGENRLIVQNGLRLLPDTHNLGLKTLIQATGIREKDLTTYHIGYIIGPCLNASGRLQTVEEAILLFLINEPEEAKNIARNLIKLNQQRKDITNIGTITAIAQIEENLILENDNNRLLLIYNPQIHESVAGIIAGKIKEKYNRPTIVVGGEKDHILKGSCRSIEGYNIMKGLKRVEDLLATYGGHPLAAGFTVERDYLPLLAERLNQDPELLQMDFAQILRIDKYLPLSHCDLNLAEEIKKLEPFGIGNPIPYFVDRNVLIDRITLIGKDESVVRMHCKISGRNNWVELISFNGKDQLFQLLQKDDVWDQLLQGKAPGIRMDIIYTIKINEFQNRKKIQLCLLDFRLGEKQTCPH